jgi:vacuolar-type H+-ATPase subunit E/Vma4
MALAMSYIQLFQMLKAKIGEQEAEALVEFVDAKVKESVKENNEQNLRVFSTKEDAGSVKQEITNLRSELKQEIAALRTELKVDIATAKADMIKWMFIFWIGQLAAFIAIAKFFFGK